MKVQELIDKLQAIEDKTLPVCIDDWNEGYMPALEFVPITEEIGKYCVDLDNGSFAYAEGKFLKLGSS